MTLLLNRKLALRIEENVRIGNQQIVRAWNAMDSTNELKTMEMGGAIAIYGGTDCPLNETIGLGMSSPVDADMLSQIEDFYRSNGYPTTIRACPLAHPSLIEHTKERGYALTGYSYRWILDLSSWESPFDRIDSRVRAATPAEELAWARTVEAGFADEEEVSKEQPMNIPRAFFRMESSIPVIAVAEEAFAGREAVAEGTFAGGGVLALDGEMAALFATSVRPSYRRRGIQTALLDWRLRYAKEHGARIATIETDPDSDSQRNVERMGFHLAYVTAELRKPVAIR